jgi:hypothetical protein
MWLFVVNQCGRSRVLRDTVAKRPVFLRYLDQIDEYVFEAQARVGGEFLRYRGQVQFLR